MAEASVETAPPPDPAKKPKWKVIIVAVVVALVAGGATAYFVAKRKPQESTAANAKQDAKEPRAPAVYVEFDPPFVVNFEARGLVRFLQVTVQIMTRDTEVAELVKKHDPRIRNDLLMLLGNQTYETLSTRAGKEQLRTEALQVVAEVLDSEAPGTGRKIEDLYFTSFVMQ